MIDKRFVHNGVIAKDKLDGHIFYVAGQDSLIEFVDKAEQLYQETLDLEYENENLKEEIKELKQKLFEAKKDYLIETSDNNPYLKYEIEGLKKEILGQDCPECGTKMVEHDYGPFTQYCCEKCGNVIQYSTQCGEW